LSEAPRTELVELVEETTVAARGNVHRAWFVKLRDAWVRARSVPGANVELLSRGPGVVVRIRVTLELPRGTLVECRESRPSASRQSTLEHLTAARRAPPRRQTTNRYRVARRGALEPEGDGGPAR
jgi:hypothetical protein